MGRVAEGTFGYLIDMDDWDSVEEAALDAIEGQRCQREVIVAIRHYVEGCFDDVDWEVLQEHSDALLATNNRVILGIMAAHGNSEALMRLMGMV